MRWYTLVVSIELRENRFFSDYHQPPLGDFIKTGYGEKEFFIPFIRCVPLGGGGGEEKEFILLKSFTSIVFDA